MRCASILLGILLTLSACAITPGVDQRDAAARLLAEQGGLLPFALTVNAALPLKGYARLQDDGGALVIYIEGDGRAWLDRHTPSGDPTPINPVALKLAAIDTGENVVYLGRPGQYIHGRVDRRYWLGSRFAPEVVDTYVAAVTELASSINASSIDLVGYSGGGAIAALVVARLQQAAPARTLSLRTVAGNIDTQAWTTLKKITPMSESLNPADDAAILRDIPQVHLVGTRDRQVPRAVFDAYAGKLGSVHCVRVVEVDATHAGPWDEAWRKVMAEPATCTR